MQTVSSADNERSDYRHGYEPDTGNESWLASEEQRLAERQDDGDADRYGVDPEGGQ